MSTTMSSKANSVPFERPGFIQRNLIWAFAVVVLAVLPLIFDRGLGMAVLNQMLIMILFTVSYNMLLGQGGMLSFGHAVYFGRT